MCSTGAYGVKQEACVCAECDYVKEDRQREGEIYFFPSACYNLVFKQSDVII